MEIREGTTFCRFSNDGSLYTILRNPNSMKLDITYKSTNPNEIDKIMYCNSGFLDESYFRTKDTILKSYPYKKGDWVKILTYEGGKKIDSFNEINSVDSSTVRFEDGFSSSFLAIRPAFSDEIPKVKTKEAYEDQFTDKDTKSNVIVLQDGEIYYWETTDKVTYLDKLVKAENGYFNTCANIDIFKKTFSPDKEQLSVDSMKNLRIATLEEKQWLNDCINANKFVNKENTMNDKDFKIGDRVSVSGLESAIQFSGQKGTIRCIENSGSQRYHIEFDERFNTNLWNCRNVTSSKGYQVTRNNLTLISEENMNDFDTMIKEKEAYMVITSGELNSTSNKLSSASEMKTTISQIKPRSKKVCYTSTVIKIAM